MSNTTSRASILKRALKGKKGENMLKAFSFILVPVLLLTTLFGCARNGVIKDTSTDTESESMTDTGSESMTESETTPQSESETAPIQDNDSQSETQTETDTDTEDTLFSDFFGKTREEIMNARGNGDVSTNEDEDDSSLRYTDRYAGFSGSSRYSFDEEGNLGSITLSFDEGFTLEEIAEAVTKLNAEAVTQNGETVWTEGDYVYRLTSADDRPVLTISKGEPAPEN